MKFCINKTFKKRYVLALFIFLATATGLFAMKEIIDYTSFNAKATFSLRAQRANYTVEKIEENTDKYQISVYYPVTQDEKLNEYILISLNNKITEFKKYIDDNFAGVDKLDFKFKLDVIFSSYESENTISFLFDILEYYGGSHDINSYISVNYDIKNNTVLNITDILKTTEQQNKVSEYVKNYMKNITDFDIQKSSFLIDVDNLVIVVPETREVDKVTSYSFIKIPSDIIEIED